MEDLKNEIDANIFAHELSAEIDFQIEQYSKLYEVKKWGES